MATEYTCHYCKTTSIDPGRSCPACGGPIDVAAVVTRAGWEELPAIADMAHIQFGRSRVQIEGELVPVADFALHDDEEIWFNHHVLLWKDPQVHLERMSMSGGVKRVFAGIPLILCRAKGPGHIALSFDHSGEIVAVPLQQNQSIITLEHHFLGASSTIVYDYQQSPVWFRTRNGDETETHYPMGRYIDEFTAKDGHGLLLLHAKGNVFRRELAAGEEVLVKGAALLYVDGGMAFSLHLEGVVNRGARLFGPNFSRFAWVRLQGPGRIAIQSVHGQHEVTSNNVVASANGTTNRNWT